MAEVPASLKAARAVWGDDFFIERLKVVCSIEECEYSERLALMVANSVADQITVDGNMTVNTLGVDDSKLKSALRTQWNKLEDGGSGDIG